jgi:hypothetical protein
MEAKDEIEKLADSWSDDYEQGSNRYIAKRSYIAGYTQCKEDMIEKLEMHILINEDDWNRNPHTQFRDFVEQLKNKQYETQR